MIKRDAESPQENIQKKMDVDTVSPPNPGILSKIVGTLTGASAFVI